MRLQIINFLNQATARSSNSNSVIEVAKESWTQFDVDGNGKVSPLDVLLVINRINIKTRLNTPFVKASDTSDIAELSKSKLQLRSQVVEYVQKKSENP